MKQHGGVDTCSNNEKSAVPIVKGGDGVIVDGGEVMTGGGVE